MSDEIKYTLNVQSVDNPLTKEEGDSVPADMSSAGHEYQDFQSA